MTDNEIISQARGECRHAEFSSFFLPFSGKTRNECKACDKKWMGDNNQVPQYDSDPAAWTPELYQWIEDEGLWEQFTVQVAWHATDENTNIF